MIKPNFSASVLFLFSGMYTLNLVPRRQTVASLPSLRPRVHEYFSIVISRRAAASVFPSRFSSSADFPSVTSVLAYSDHASYHEGLLVDRQKSEQSRRDALRIRHVQVKPSSTSFIPVTLLPIGANFESVEKEIHV